jgi:DNA polymerase-3 subunit alpha
MSSAFDGLGSEQAFADRAAELGQPAIGLTEHGSIRGIYEAHLACKAAGIKYVPGVECYLVDDALRRGLTDDEKAAVKRDHPEKDDQKAALTAAEKEIRDRDHLTVWAMNDVGIHNLYRLTHRSWTTGFYYKPRVQIEDVIEFGDGLLVSSGCPNGAVASPIRSGKVDVALRRAQQLSEAFGDRFYVEIMPHLVENGHALARKLVRIADRVRAKIIATQDAHYPRAEDSVAQEVLLAIQTRSTMTNPDRFRFTTRDFWLRSRAEMETAFLISYPDLDGRIVKQALDETVAFADRVNVEIPLARSGAYLVAPDLPAGIAHYNSWLINECGKGSISRFGRPIHELDSIYKDRLLHELRTIRDMNFSAYFIMVQDMIDWARSQGIKIGPGRGSAAGSLIAYLLRITDLDPVKYGLMFERMLAPGRKDLPDVDTDAQHDRRDEVIEYLRRKYGEDRVARISSRVILGGKGALQDLARVYEIPIKDVTPVSGLIVNAIAEEDQSET